MRRQLWRALTLVLFAALLVPILAPDAGAQSPSQKAGQTSTPGPGGGPQAIVGGDDVLPGTYPFMVSLQRVEERQFPASIFDQSWSEWTPSNPTNELVGHRCGATLIAPRWVLTAAHCVDQTVNVFGGITVRRQFRFDALIGPTVLTEDGPTAERIAVEQTIVHPNWSNSWNQVQGGNDIALLKLAAPSSADPVVLRNIQPGAGTLSMLVGWGWQDFDPGISTHTDHLQQASVPMVNPSSCSSTPGTICFSNGEGEPAQGACIGDSGGPSLVWNATLGRWEQTGVSSFAVGACVGTSVYTHLGSHWQFIFCTTGVLVAGIPRPRLHPCAAPAPMVDAG